MKTLATYSKNALGRVLRINLNHSHKAPQSLEHDLCGLSCMSKVIHPLAPCQAPTPLAAYIVYTLMHTWAFFSSKLSGSLDGGRLPPATTCSALGCRLISIMGASQCSPLGHGKLSGANSNASKGTSVPVCPLQRAGASQLLLSLPSSSPISYWWILTILPSSFPPLLTALWEKTACAVAGVWPCLQWQGGYAC